jgi:molybdate transport system ATP-binding protein
MTLHADLRVQRGDFVLDAAFRAEPGELLVLVGPNGAGKTTALRALGGLERLSRGRVVLDGSTLDNADGTFVPPHLRSTGLVPQADRLLPHLDARSNVAFGLRCRGVRRNAAEAEAMHWLGVVGLEDCAAHRPDQLSGGQAKRVALARALAIRPRMLLMDEPFAGLDASTRLLIRRELRTYLEAHEGVRVLVTHEPLDALALADRIVVLEGGRVVQDVRPDELRTHPRSRYVADLVGVNLYRGTLVDHGLRTDTGAEIVAADTIAGSGPGLATIHPRAVALHISRPEGSPRNVWRGRITEIDNHDERRRVRIEGELAVVAEVTADAAAALRLAPGIDVYAAAKASEVNLYSA